MKRSIMLKWVKALESGNYRQTTHSLRSRRNNKAYGYCCLGVLCDLYAKENKNSYWQKSGSGLDEKFVIVSKSGIEIEERFALPRKVRNWAEIKTKEGDFLKKLKGQSVKSLIQANDDLGLSFREIAKIIRKNYKSL